MAPKTQRLCLAAFRAVGRLTMVKVKPAALKLAQTEDEEYCLHPEYLVATMPNADAKAWQGRLRGM
jgi:hypothetical protein